MARDLTVKARIVAVDDASATVAKVQSRFERLGGFLRSNFALGFGAASVAVGVLVKGLKAAVTEAAEAEVAVNRLEQSLQRFGTNAAGVEASLLKQADALAKTTKATDEQVIATQTLLANMGQTPAEIERVTRAAADLSAAFGIDLDSAAAALARSLEGNGRALAQLIPEIKNLEAAALKAGEGLKIVEERTGGAAAAELNTFTGAVGQLGKALAELAEAAATPVVESQALVGVIQALTTAIANFTPAASASAAAVTGGGEAARNAALNYLALQRGALAAVVGVDALAAAEQRAARITEENATAQDALLAALAKAGVTLRDFEAELRANEAALAALDAQYRATGQNVAGYRLAVEQLKEAQALIRAEMQDAATGTTAFTDALRESKEEATGANAAYRTLNTTLRLVTTTANQSAAALHRTALAAAEAGDIPAAIAAGATLSQGGTRIRLPGGGSRLNRTGQVA